MLEFPKHFSGGDISTHSCGAHEMPIIWSIDANFDAREISTLICKYHWNEIRHDKKYIHTITANDSVATISKSNVRRAGFFISCRGDGISLQIAPQMVSSGFHFGCANGKSIGGF